MILDRNEKHVIGYWRKGNPCYKAAKTLAKLWLCSSVLWKVQFSSVQSLSHVRLFATPWTATHQASLSIPTPRVYTNSCPLNWWCHPTISSSVIPFSSCPQSFPASGSFQMSQPFASGGQGIGVLASTSVLPLNIQYWSPLDGLVGSSHSPRESQESSPTPQIKSINCSVLSFLYSPTLTSIHDYWENQ